MTAYIIDSARNVIGSIATDASAVDIAACIDAAGAPVNVNRFRVTRSKSAARAAARDESIEHYRLIPGTAVFARSAVVAQHERDAAANTAAARAAQNAAQREAAYDSTMHAAQARASRKEAFHREIVAGLESDTPRA